MELYALGNLCPKTVEEAIDMAPSIKEFVKVVIAYQKKLNSSTSVPKPLKLNQ
ncbi:hypothetical protein CCACVL1_22639 [Corchorus capsularis]|uniref:Uncharacterized protein n=1 Tax=Corchorus capsularis TaxID=210143 RepID=A0A1R3GXF9_COCAP|nr:hypothetical protein CCACVL1_22639 [Corchorus capsularis]